MNFQELRDVNCCIEGRQSRAVQYGMLFFLRISWRRQKLLSNTYNYSKRNCTYANWNQTGTTTLAINATLEPNWNHINKSISFCQLMHYFNYNISKFF